MTAKDLSAKQSKQIFPNDAFQVESPCLDNFLEGILFWSKHTPASPALFYPRTPSSQSMETVQWNELKVSCNHGKK